MQAVDHTITVVPRDFSSARATEPSDSMRSRDNPSRPKPNKRKLPAHISDQARQLMAGTVFNAKDAQQVVMANQMRGPMAMNDRSSMPVTNGAHHHPQMNMPHSSSAPSSHMHMQGMHGGGMPMSSGAMAATATIGSALAAGGAVISIVNAHQLGRDWDNMSAAERTGETMKLTGTVALAGVGGTISCAMAQGCAMAVMPVVAVAGPAGLGAVAAGNVIAGAYNGYKAAQAVRTRSKINSYEARQTRDGNRMTQVGTTLFARAKQKLSSEIKNRAVKIGIIALTTAGIIIGAALIGGFMATPAGWIAAGLVLGGFIFMTGIMIGRHIHQKYKAGNQVEGTDVNNLARLIRTQNRSNNNFKEKIDQLQGILLDIDDQINAHQAKSGMRHFAEILGAKNRQKAGITALRNQLRRWFYDNSKLFSQDAGNTDAENPDQVMLKVLELNEDLLLKTARTLVREQEGL